jgi:uncharacterized protein (DUF433 family)
VATGRNADNGWPELNSKELKAETPNIRNEPAYGLAEGARYVRLPAATLRTWLVGRDYPKGDGKGKFHPLIKPARREPLQLSFYNLVEAHVLRALRTEHGVAITELRDAITYAQKRLDIERLLLSPELRTHGGKVFLDRYVELINLGASGQLAMRRMFEAHLKRVEWDKWKFPVRLFPYAGAALGSEDRAIVIDPQIAFGRPIVPRAGVSVIAIADRIDAGESIDAIAQDYDLSHDEVEQAVLYTRAA